MIGLGTMGSNLLQNIADKGYSCAGYDVNDKQVEKLNQLNRDSIRGFSDLAEFVKRLETSRKIILLVPAGPIVDHVIESLLAFVEEGDVIIDAGNSHYIDTDRRYEYLEKKGIHFIGMGVSGGEEGARRGPSMMPGGDKEAYEKIEPILTKAAAHVNGEPTIAFMGNKSAGHFVKMVHNGIEYAIMQLISETFAILRNRLKMDDNEIHDVYKSWNEGRLQSYLIEITRNIFAFKSAGADHILLHDILDVARAKGTGKWTSQVAMDLNVPVPLIDISVSMRDLSKYKNLRTESSQIFDHHHNDNFHGDRKGFLANLEAAYYFGMITAYAQGMHLLQVASESFKYNLNLTAVAKIWRGGCIIRSAFLNPIYSAYEHNKELGHLFLDPVIQDELKSAIPALRKIVADAALSQVAVPGLSSALAYFDNFRSEQMPTNLIQAQRDYFGSHTYELIGKVGNFHNLWS